MKRVLNTSIKSLVLAGATVLSLSAAAQANIPTIQMPDLTFPPAQPDVTTQDCQSILQGLGGCQ
ncbi:MAG: hypothetical protein N4A53_00655 [Pelagimonas sp.]|jgi:hypothetical protein|nr:hypothetical protein [Pelagimonas sp.]